MSALEAIRLGLIRVLSIICAILFATLVLDVLWGVFTRQVLDAQPAWTEELARFLLVWLALLGGVLAYAADQHLGVDVLVTHCDDGSRRIARLVSHLSILGFAVAVLLIGGLELFTSRWESAQTLAAMGIRKAWFYLVLPLSGLLISLLAMIKIVALWRPSPSREEVTP